jgi:myo-inositol 2-dehydrogenase/D-chiro-inositol 1-dehydrogenase
VSAPAVAPPSGAERSDRKPVRVGVIGTGRIGRMHAELLATRVPGAALAAVSDAVMPLAQDVGQALGVPVLETEQLLHDPAIAAVAICAPTETHVPFLIAAAQAGKAVFCEKPISLDLGEVDRALSVVARTGTALMVGFNRRFDVSHTAVRDAVAGGLVGAPEVLRITSRDPGPPPLAYARTSGGIFLDMTIHDFDMARYIVGSEVVEVFAAGAVRVVPELADFGDVDTAVVTMSHENECITVIDNSRRASYGYDQRVEVLGAKALAASENPLVNSALVRDAGGARLATLPYFFIERYTVSYLRQWEAFVAAVTSGTPPPTTGQDGRAALVLGLTAKRSLLERRPVRVSEVDAAPKAAG